MEANKKRSNKAPLQIDSKNFENNSKTKVMNIFHSPQRPNQNVRSSSKAAFAEYRTSDKPTTEKSRALKALKLLGVGSRKMISIKADIPINHITQCVKNLLQDGKIIELPIKRKCEITKRMVYFLTVNDENNDK